MTKSASEESFEHLFVSGLLGWNKKENKRQMPWKGEKDPYKIWLSEIILQQTRVEQGWNYYTRFLEAFPTIHQLANASEQQVYKLWEGLGYYTRCKNLIATARYISTELNGIFPNDFSSILRLKGIGPYTAAAIGSFAFNLPFAVLDGNVFRVLSRIYADKTPIDATEGKNHFTQIAQKLLPEQQAGVYNQAIMDFGATICRPQPECTVCFFNKYCLAFKQKNQLLLPVKTKQNKIRQRWFHYIVFQYEDAVAIRQRTQKDIWQHLYEPLLIEAEKPLTKNHLLAQVKKSFGITFADYEIISAAADHSQKLSHQHIHFSFIHLLFCEKKEVEGFMWVSNEKLNLYPFPKTIKAFLSKNIP